MQSVAIVVIGVVRSESLIGEKEFHLLGSEIFLAYEFDERDLVEGVDVIDGAAEVA
jgi:hypothetical protein